MTITSTRRGPAPTATTNHGPIIAIYARISADRENDRDGVRRQQAACRNLAVKLADEFDRDTRVEVYEDNDISAVADYRPEFARLTADIAAGKVAIVLAWNSARIYRDTDDERAMQKLLIATATLLQTIKGGRVNYNSADGRAQARDEASYNQREREKIAENTLAAKIDDAEQGRWRGGRVPLGYRREGKYGLAIDPEPAAAVREAVQGILAGRTVTGVARDLNARLGLSMRPTAVSLLLRRRSIAGLVERHGEIVGEASWPGIITREESERVRDILTDPARRTGPGPSRRHLGSGLFVSAVDGSPVYPSGGSRNRSGNSTRIVSYAATGVNRRTDLVDRFVRGVVAERLSDPDIARLVRSQTVPVVSAARTELDGLKTRVRNLHALYAEEGQMTLEELTASTRGARARIAALEAEITAAAKVSPTAAVFAADVPAVMFLQSDVDVQRAVIDLFCTVVIHPTRRGRPSGWKPGQPYASADGVEIVWKL